MAVSQNTEDIELSDMASHLPRRPIPTSLQYDSRWAHPSLIAISESEQQLRPSTSRMDPRRAFTRNASGRLPPNRTVRSDLTLPPNMPLNLRALPPPQSSDSDCFRQRRLEICLLLFAVLMAILLFILLIAITFHLIAKLNWQTFHTEGRNGVTKIWPTFVPYIPTRLTILQTFVYLFDQRGRSTSISHPLNQSLLLINDSGISELSNTAIRD